MLLSSFLLCCFLPTLLPWFPAGDGALRGIRLMWPLLLAGTGLYLWALHAGRCRRVLLLGGLAHGALLLGYLLAFFTFSPAAQGLSDRLDAAQAGFWVGLALLAAHLALFVTTETAIRRLLEKRRPRPQP